MLFLFHETQETNDDDHAKEQQGVQTEQTKKQGQMLTKTVPSTPSSKTNEVKPHAPAPTTLKQKSYACTDEVQTLFTFFD